MTNKRTVWGDPFPDPPEALTMEKVMNLIYRAPDPLPDLIVLGPPEPRWRQWAGKVFPRLRRPRSFKILTCHDAVRMNITRDPVFISQSGKAFTPNQFLAYHRPRVMKLKGDS